MSDAPIEVMRVVECVMNRQNVCVLGPGGTGKTWGMKYVTDILKQRGIGFAVLAPTGAATTALIERGIEAVTLHSWSGIGGKSDDDDFPPRRIFAKLRRYGGIEKILKAKWILIDEISMVGSKLFEKFYGVLEEVWEHGRFTGMVKEDDDYRFIFLGDFLQLAPVKDDWIFKNEVFQNISLEYISFSVCRRYTSLPPPTYEGIDIGSNVSPPEYSSFDNSDSSPSEDSPSGDVSLLPLSHSQNEGGFSMSGQEFFDMLCRIREGNHTEDDIAALEYRQDIYFEYIMRNSKRSSSRPENQIKPTMLLSTNKQCLAHNIKMMKKLDTEEYTYKAHFDFDESVLSLNDVAIAPDDNDDDSSESETESSSRTKPLSVADKKALSQMKESQKTKYESVVSPSQRFKVGAQVMLKINICVPRGLVNGARGVVTEIIHPKDNIISFNDQSLLAKLEKAGTCFDNTILTKSATPPNPEKEYEDIPFVIVVRFLNNQVYSFAPVNISYDDEINFIRGPEEARKTGKKVLGWRSRYICFPLILAWGITVHKSQGLTLDLSLIHISEPTRRS